MKRIHRSETNPKPMLLRVLTGGVLAGLWFFTGGCTRTVEVPRENFDMVRDSGAEYLRVRTMAGETWIIQECWATDSTLVVSMTKGRPAQNDTYPARASMAVLIRHRPPMEIPFEEICWIDRVERDMVVSNAAAVSVGVVGAIFALLLLASSGSSSGGY